MPVARCSATTVAARPTTTRSSPTATSGRPNRLTIRPPSSGGGRRAEGERGDRQAGVQRAVAEAVLQVQGEDEEDRGEAARSRPARSGRRGCTTGSRNSRRSNSGFVPRARTAAPRGRRRRARPGRPGPAATSTGRATAAPAPAAAAASTTPTPSSRTPTGSRLVPAGFGRRRGRAAAARPSEHRDEPTGTLTKKTQPPAVLVAAERDQQPAEQRADRGRDADRGAEQPERPRPAPAPRNSCWIRPVTCGLTTPAGGALHAAGRRPATSARSGEPGRARWSAVNSAIAEDERVAPAAGVAEPPGGHQHQAEGERVPGEHPLQVARRSRRSARSMEGSATLTMLTSSSVMNAATRQTPRACQRRRLSTLSAPPAASAPVRRVRPPWAHRAPRRPSITYQ